MARSGEDRDPDAVGIFDDRHAVDAQHVALGLARSRRDFPSDLDVHRHCDRWGVVFGEVVFLVSPCSESAVAQCCPKSVFPDVVEQQRSIA